MNIAFKRHQDNNNFDKSEITIVQFNQVIDTTSDLKLVKWNFAFAQKKVQTVEEIRTHVLYNWSDYDMKLLFTLINPQYFTAS